MRVLHINLLEISLPPVKFFVQMNQLRREFHVSRFLGGHPVLGLTAKVDPMQVFEFSAGNDLVDNWAELVLVVIIPLQSTFPNGFEKLVLF
jgi:hypothetical protein